MSSKKNATQKTAETEIVAKDAEAIVETKKSKLKMTKEEAKAKVLAKRAALNYILEMLNSYIRDGLVTEGRLVEAVKLITPPAKKQRTEKAKKESSWAQLRKIIGPTGHQLEDEIWKNFRIGRVEMARLRKVSAKVGYFVNFDLVNGQYDEVIEREFKLR